MKSIQDKIKHEEKYIIFLETRLRSLNFKKNSTPEEFEKTEGKLKKSKLVLKMLNSKQK
jgi:hypothetical protein